jgi:putative OPT family oligopeptide transporter
MLVGAVSTLYKMRTQLFGGIARAMGDISKAAGSKVQQNRCDKDLDFKWIFSAIGIGVIFMAALYYYFCGSLGGAIVAAVAMAVTGFFFSAVSGYLVGLIGSSNNPISGLTLSTLIIAALLMVLIGVKGEGGVAAVLGVAAVVCCMCGVAGDMLQDLKVGKLLGGTPWKMEIGEIIGVIAAALVMYVPLFILHVGDMKMGGVGFGGKDLPAPQAGLMAMLAKGIVTGQMAWPLVIAGMLMSVSLILIGAPSPMLIAVGMYLPIQTTFAVFVGGVIKWLVDVFGRKKNLNDRQLSRVSNNGILLASGFIAGEALIGLLVAALAFFNIMLPHVFDTPSIWIGLFVLFVLGWILVKIPLGNAGSANE